MEIYLSVTAEDYPRAAAFGQRFAFVAYRIGTESALLRQALPLLPAPRRGIPVRRNLLSLSDRDCPPVEDPEALCGGVLRECGRRGYAGAVLDFETAPREDLSALAACLDRRLPETGRRLYVPEEYAAAAPGAVELLCTAVSGGSFEEHLREAAEQRGGDLLALDAQRLRMDFRLPAPSGEGEPLDEAAFRELAEGKSVFFSPDLCSRYFTFSQGNEAHFVLYDDADTLNRKLDLGQRYGVRAAFLQWPEIADLAGDLRLDR